MDGFDEEGYGSGFDNSEWSRLVFGSKRSRANSKKLLAVLAGAIFILIVLSQVLNKTNSRDKVAIDYLRAIAHKDYPHAYDLLCTNQQRRLTLKTFGSEVDRDLFKRVGSKFTLHVIGSGQDAEGHWKVRYDIRTPKFTESHEINMTKTKGKWRACGDQGVSEGK